MLLDALMRSCLVEVGYICIEHAARVASPEGSAGGRGILAAHSCAKRSQIALARGA